MLNKNKKIIQEPYKLDSHNKMLLSGILILVAGIVLLICHNSINRKGFVVVGGILFILAGIINMFLFRGKVDEKTCKNAVSGFSRALGVLVSVASVVLGVTMLLFETTFEVLVDPLFGILMGFAALVQLYIIVISSRPVKLPAWTYIYPVTVAIIAVVIFIVDLSDSGLMITMGVGLIIFGVGGFTESLMVGAGNRMLSQIDVENLRGNKRPENEVEDIDPKEVKQIKSLDD